MTSVAYLAQANVIANENIKVCDIDDTLIITKTGLLEHRHVDVLDPVNGTMLTFRVHEPNVRLIKEELQRGAHVLVWSRGGWNWANNVISALGIDSKNITVLSKPLVYFDDKDVQHWLKDRVWLDPDVPYKK